MQGIQNWQNYNLKFRLSMKLSKEITKNITESKPQKWEFFSISSQKWELSCNLHAIMISQWFIILNSNPETRCQWFCPTHKFYHTSFLPRFNFASISNLSYNKKEEWEKKKSWKRKNEKNISSNLHGPFMCFVRYTNFLVFISFVHYLLFLTQLMN